MRLRRRPSSARIVTNGTPLESSRQGLFNRLEGFYLWLIMIKDTSLQKVRKMTFSDDVRYQVVPTGNHQCLLCQQCPQLRTRAQLRSLFPVSDLCQNNKEPSFEQHSCIQQQKQPMVIHDQKPSISDFRWLEGLQSCSSHAIIAIEGVCHLSLVNHLILYPSFTIAVYAKTTWENPVMQISH